MANRIRFTTAQQVVEAYPAVAGDFEDVSAQLSPIEYIDHLCDTNRQFLATIFAGLALPKREAVWWACLALRGLGLTEGTVGEGLRLAEAWVRNPEEDERRAAGQFAEDNYFEGAGAWVAFAAFTTSGSMAPAGLQSVPPSPEVSGKCAAIAVIKATSDKDAFVQLERLRAAVECAKDFAAGGEGTAAWRELAAGKFRSDLQAAE